MRQEFGWLAGVLPSLPETYLNTETERALHSALDRGGVIGGSSTGAQMQGCLSSAAHSDKGFGFLRRSYVLPHLNIDNARSFLTRVIMEHPGIVGIGVPERTAAIIVQDRLEVVGDGEIVIDDGRIHDGNPYGVLRPGARFDLGTSVVDPN